MMMMMMMMLMGSYQTPSPLLQAVMRLLTFLAIFLYSFNRRSESISGQSENHHSSLAQVNIYPKHEVVKHGDAAFQSVAWICAKPPLPWPPLTMSLLGVHKLGPWCHAVVKVPFPRNLRLCQLMSPSSSAARLDGNQNFYTKKIFFFQLQLSLSCTNRSE